jgi:hypothetical protein
VHIILEMGQRLGAYDPTAALKRGFEDLRICWQRGSACIGNPGLCERMLVLDSKALEEAVSLKYLGDAVMGLEIEFNKNELLMSIVSWPESSMGPPRHSSPTPFVILKFRITHTIDGETSSRRQALRHLSKNRYQKSADSLEDRWSLLRPAKHSPRRVVVIL